MSIPPNIYKSIISMSSEGHLSSWYWNRKLAQKDRDWKGNEWCGSPREVEKLRLQDIHIHKGTEMQWIEPLRNKEHSMLHRAENDMCYLLGPPVTLAFEGRQVSTSIHHVFPLSQTQTLLIILFLCQMPLPAFPLFLALVCFSTFQSNSLGCWLYFFCCCLLWQGRSK